MASWGVLARPEVTPSWSFQRLQSCGGVALGHPRLGPHPILPPGGIPPHPILPPGGIPPHPIQWKGDIILPRPAMPRPPRRWKEGGGGGPHPGMAWKGAGGGPSHGAWRSSRACVPPCRAGARTRLAWRPGSDVGDPMTTVHSLLERDNQVRVRIISLHSHGSKHTTTTTIDSFIDRFKSS